MTDYSNLVKRQREISEASYKMRDNIYRPVNETADALEAKDAEIDYWKNRTREALETIKNNVDRIAELEASIDKNDEWAKWFIEKTDARIAELEKEIERVDEWAKGYIEKADTHIAELEAALKPFAEVADEYELILGVQDNDQIFVPLAACRRARKVLGEKEWVTAAQRTTIDVFVVDADTHLGLWPQFAIGAQIPLGEGNVWQP